MNNHQNKKIAAFIVPTGIGASIGGYAGDASLVAKKFSDKMQLIVNPNVVNAACFSGIQENMLYVEGWTLSEFFKGNIGLSKAKNNKIGIIFDVAIPKDVLTVQINVIKAMKVVYGFDIVEYILTEKPVGVSCFIDENNQSCGQIKNEKTLLEAGEKLKNKGITSIAVVCYFDDSFDDDNEYENGDGVDIIGGVEAIISHFLTSQLKIPCVHAPAFSNLLVDAKDVHPKVAAEYIAPTFLPCLLFGLQNAPVISDYSNSDYTIENLEALILPASALGNSLTLSCIEKNIKVLAVTENKTVLNVNALNLNMTKYNNLFLFDTYDNALNFLCN